MNALKARVQGDRLMLTDCAGQSLPLPALSVAPPKGLRSPSACGPRPWRAAGRPNWIW